MKNATLIGGDLLVLLAFVTVGSAAPASTSHLDLLVSFGLFAVTCFVGGALLRAFNPSSTMPHFLMRTGATYVTAGTGALVIRLFLLPSGFFDPFSFLMIWLEGAFYFLAWRISYKLIFSLIARGGKTRKLSLTVIMLSLLIGAGVVLLRLIVIIQYAPMIYTADTLPPQSTALVLGAGLWFDGTPSTVLVNRVEAAVSLYHDGKIEHLVMSGDGISPTYDEPGAMRSLALNVGVDDADILLDRNGTRTLASCAYTRDTVNASSVVIVTQRFHLPRAIYTCERLGMRVIGMRLEEETSVLRDQANQEIRETLATALAWWETGGQLPAILMIAIAIVFSIRYVISDHRATPM